MTTIPERLRALRALMAARGLDAYIIPTSDFNGSESPAPYFRAREYMCGFTGSAGTLLVLAAQAYLWTDGRYFLQAEEELKGSGVTLMRMGECPELADLLSDTLRDNAAIGLDGRTVDAAAAREILRTLSDKNVELCYDADLVGEIWADRPPLPAAPAWLLEETYAGEAAAEKLAWVRGEMQKHCADVYVLSDLTDIAWLFNMRGGDCGHTPVPLCFCFIERERVCLCLDEEKRPPELEAALCALGAEFRPYAGVYGFADRYEQGVTVMLTAAKVNYTLWSILSQEAILLDVPDIVAQRKAVKNPVEIQNLRRACLKDGVALSRFMHWLKKSVGKRDITELSAGERLDAERLAQPGNLGLSFATICAYGPHGAIVHYEATPKSDAAIEPKGLLLVDSGGQYYEGTTDVTRTYALGPLTPEERLHYTLVLKGMLDLMAARFPSDTRGEELDTLARAPIWAEGLDYRHGTGHGIGYLLSVHEDPVRIRRKGAPPLSPGMVLSDEPGVYIEGKHGVRLENQLVCVQDIKNEYGSFLRFEALTIAPIDLEPVDAALLTPTERETLNAYHQSVYEALLPAFNGEMREWLREVTLPI